MNENTRLLLARALNAIAARNPALKPDCDNLRTTGNALSPVACAESYGAIFARIDSTQFAQEELRTVVDCLQALSEAVTGARMTEKIVIYVSPDEKRRITAAAPGPRAVSVWARQTLLEALDAPRHDTADDLNPD